ncbi:hypothetical protein ACFL45_00485 [Candidatus Neomarinimicrobiota bacterium]
MQAKMLGFLILFSVSGIHPVAAQNQERSMEKGALLRSVVFPGWGQHYLGNHSFARRMMTTEVCLWLMYGGLKGAQDWYTQDFRAFATLHAGISYRLKPDIYYFRLGRYDSIEDYNQVQLRDRNIDAVYTLGTEKDWEWDSIHNRERYKDIRRASLRATKAASFMVGSMVINRAVAAIHVLFLSRKPGTDADIYLDPLPGGGRVSLGFYF